MCSSLKIDWVQILPYRLSNCYFKKIKTKTYVQKTTKKDNWAISMTMQCLNTLNNLKPEPETRNIQTLNIYFNVVPEVSIRSYTYPTMFRIVVHSG